MGNNFAQFLNFYLMYPDKMKRIETLNCYFFFRSSVEIRQKVRIAKIAETLTRINVMMIFIKQKSGPNLVIFFFWHVSYF